MARGRVILLNGSSSAGKTTLAHAVQRASTRPVQHIALDHFRDGLAGRFRGMNSRPDEPGARGLNVVPVGDMTALHFGDIGRATLKGMRRAVAAFAQTGIDVVVDDLLLERGFLQDYLRVLDGFDVTFVGVICDLETVVARGKRASRPVSGHRRRALRAGPRGVPVRHRSRHRRHPRRASAPSASSPRCGSLYGLPHSSACVR